MTEPCIMACDPGLTGALAFFFPVAPERVAVDDMPTVNGEVDVARLGLLIRQMGPTLAVVEQVGPQPRDGVKQAFQFGGAYHALRAAITMAVVPMQLVTPVTWKRHHRLIGADDPKEAARALALRVFLACAASFARKKDHNGAEAALLARFAADTLNG